MKKIIFIHLLNDYSGSPKVLSQVINATLSNGHDAELFTGKNDDGFLSNLTNNHHSYFYKRYDNKYLTLITFLLSQTSLFLKLLRFKNQDVIFYINTMLPFGAALAGKLLGKPVYYHVHETSLRPLLLKRFLRFIIQTTASKVFFVSNNVKEAETFLDKKQTVVYNALSNDFVKVANKNTYHWRNNELFTVLMICSLKAYKGINEFISVAQQCLVNEKIVFTLVLNAEQVEIDQYFLHIKIPSNITLISRKTNLVPFYQQTSLLLNLSRIDQWIETFGLTIIEAMAFGIPVIVPPKGGPTEIVTNDLEGFLISSYETDKISTKIIELSTKKNVCLRLSTNARKRSKDFNQDVFEDDVMRVLNE